MNENNTHIDEETTNENKSNVEKKNSFKFNWGLFFVKLILIYLILVVNYNLIKSNSGYYNNQPQSIMPWQTDSYGGSRYINNGKIYNLFDKNSNVTKQVISFITTFLICLININLIKKVNWKYLIIAAVVLYFIILAINGTLYTSTITVSV